MAFFALPRGAQNCMKTEGKFPLIFLVGGDDETAHILSGVTKKGFVANCKESFALEISNQTTVCAAVRRYYSL